MRAIAQWFVWRLEWDAEERKYQKTPCALDGSVYRLDASLPSNWTRYESAAHVVQELNARPECSDKRLQYALGFWMTEDCGYWFFDLDQCVVDGVVGEGAASLMALFPGALMEFSSSGHGVHIIGNTVDAVPEHRTKPPAAIKAALRPMELEFYTSGRGLAFGLSGIAKGSADSVHDDAVGLICHHYFPSVQESEEGVWDKPRADWRGPVDDDELIERALRARVSAASAFGGKASFAQLWRGEAEHSSESDMALAAHLAFWTGCDAPRIERLMRRSGMKRDKWDVHRTYLRELTIQRACDGCSAVYAEGSRGDADGGSGDGGAVNPCTELENAHRLRNRYGNELLYVGGIGWHQWEPPWVWDEQAALRRGLTLGRIVQEEVPALEAWAESVFDLGLGGTEEQDRREEIRDNRRKWVKSSESRAVIGNSLALLQPMLSVSAEVMDKQPLLVGCPNGVIDLQSVSVREHRREDFITKTISVDYDATARAPRWEAFIHEIMGGDAELTSYLQTLCGYVLSAHRVEHILPILYGTGANGKSTFLKTLQTLMGDYAGSAPPGLLISSGENAHPTGLASLQGRRLVVISETGEGGKLNEEQVKLLTGGDRIAARLMRQNFFEFDPTHVCVLQTNHKPRVTGADEGIWRRMKLIPFTVTIPPDKRDPNLPKALLDELPGILVWAVEGWKMYQQRGFVEPSCVRAATAEYRSESDHVGAFLSERCILAPQRFTTSAELYAAYRRWCDESGERSLTQRTFAQRLAERPGVEQTRTGSARGWRGVVVDHAGPLRIIPGGLGVTQVTQ